MTQPYEHVDEYHVPSPVQVHVVNASDFIAADKPLDVRHVAAHTFTDIGVIIELLQLDPLRVKSEFFISGVGTVQVCHTQAQAQAAVTGVAGTHGALVTCPGAAAGSIHWTDYSQAKLWAVLTGASPVISVISERCAA